MGIKEKVGIGRTFRRGTGNSGWNGLLRSVSSVRQAGFRLGDQTHCTAGDRMSIHHPSHHVHVVAGLFHQFSAGHIHINHPAADAAGEIPVSLQEGDVPQQVALAVSMVLWKVGIAALKSDTKMPFAFRAALTT